MTSLRDAESATAGVPVVRGLVWRDLRPNAFPDMWCAASQFGVYDIEEHSASDSPVFVALGPYYAPIAEKDSLDEAKEACQADYEQRILSALNPDFLSALDTARAEIERLRAALEPFALVAEEDIGDSEADEGRFVPMSSQTARAPQITVGDIRRAADALSAPSSTYQSALTAAQARIAELEGFVADARKLATKFKGAHKLAGPHDPSRLSADRLNKAWADGVYGAGKDLLALVRTLSPVKENDRG